MKKILCVIGFLISFTALLIFGCKKEKAPLPPAINYKTGSNYTQNNAVVAVGHKLFFGIQARGTSAEITNFTIKKVLSDGSVITVMDSGLYSMSLDINKILYQNVENVVTWTFTVMDRNRLSAEISMVVNKDPNSTFGGIYYIPSVKIGYQNNTQYGHFLNPSTGMVYSNDSATAHQSNIGVLCYYIDDNTPSPVLSSPGEMDNSSIEAMTFYPFITSWQIRKYTLWDISVDNTPVTVADFNMAQNDSLLIVSYHDVWGKKKFRWATAGKIIPFITADGKKGLINVISADIADNGYMELAIKIQQ
jgi:hypothetical protein